MQQLDRMRIERQITVKNPVGPIDGVRLYGWLGRFCEAATKRFGTEVHRRSVKLNYNKKAVLRTNAVIYVAVDRRKFAILNDLFQFFREKLPNDLCGRPSISGYDLYQDDYLTQRLETDMVIIAFLVQVDHASWYSDQRAAMFPGEVWE